MPPISLPPLDMVLDVLLYAALPALLAAAAVMMLVERFGGAKQAPAGAAIALVVGTVLGLWLRHASFNGWPMAPGQSMASALATWLSIALTPMSGDSTWNRLPWAGLGVLCVGRVARLPDLPPIDGWLLRAAASVTAAWLVIPATLQEEFAWMMPIFALVVFAEWVILDALTAAPPGGTVLFTIALAFSVASMVFIQIGWATKADAAIVLSSALTGIAVVAAWRGVDGGGGVPLAALLLPGLMLMGQQGIESDVPWQAFALAGCAPLVLVLTLPLRKWQSNWLRVLQVVLMLLPLGGAVYLTGPIKFE